MLEFRYSRGGQEGRAEALSRMAGLKARCPGGFFTLLDVGSVDDHWTRDFCTATMDLKGSDFQGNINDPEVWNAVLAHVAQHGKFSFSVCAHTLEDVAHPSLALRILPLVSEAGLVSMPSHLRELSRVEGPYRGYIHHRWMYRERGGRLLAIPKVSVIEHLPLPADCPGDMVELQVWWSGELPFEVLNGDYLGPNPGIVKEMYLEALR